jgi:hypothetical protein
MANQSRMQKYEPLREKMFRVLDAADADRKAVNASAATNNLWRQIDRWVNEGGAGGDSTAPLYRRGL